MSARAGYLHQSLISYSRRDGRTYADALVIALQRPGYRCFIDQGEMSSGERLTSAVERSFRRSRSLVLIAAEHALLRSSFVKQEIGGFEATGRPIIPISLAGSLQANLDASSLRTVLLDRIWIDDDLPNSATGPSANVVAEIRRSFAFVRRMRIRQAVIFGIIAALTTTAAIAWWERELAVGRQREATKEKIAANANLSEMYVTLADETWAAGDFLGAEEYLAESLRLRDSYIIREKLIQLRGSGAEWGTISPGTAKVTAVAISDKNERFAVGTANGQVLIEGDHEDRVSEVFVPGQNAIGKLRFDKHGNKLFTTDHYGKIYSVDSHNLQLTKMPSSHTGEILALCVKSETDEVFSISADNTIEVTTENESNPRVFRLDLQVSSASFDRECDRAIVGSKRGQIAAWRIDGTANPLQLTGQSVIAASIEPSGLRAATIESEATIIKVWNLETATKEAELQTGNVPDFQTHIAISAHGGTAVSLGNYIDYWPRNGGFNEIRKQFDHSNGDLAFDGSGSSIIYSGDYLKIAPGRISLNDNRRSSLFDLTNGFIRSAYITEDGHYAAQVYSSDIIIVWDVSRKHKLVTLTGHNAAFSPDNRHMAFASNDGLIHFINLENGALESVSFDNFRGLIKSTRIEEMRYLGSPAKLAIFGENTFTI
jgi:WD40 repeat protein